MPQPAIKGQAFVDFITKFTTPEEKRPEEATTILTAKVPKLGLYVDVSSNEGGSGVGLCNTPFTPPDAKLVNELLLAFENVVTKFPYKFFFFEKH